MKNFLSNEIYHIEPVSNNFTKGYSQDFIINNYSNEIKKIQEYNQEGYNIYKTFNTFFDGKRKTENINELRAVFIDIDYKDKEKEDYIELRKKCKILERKYGIFPFEINNTYKGYHLLFALSKEIYYIKNELYLEIANTLVEFFQGDKAAKQITGLYKVVGFIDKKDHRNFLIENYYFATKSKKEEFSINYEKLKNIGIISEDEKLQNILKDKIYGVKTNWNDTGNLDFSKYKLSKDQQTSKIYEIVEKKGKKYEIYDVIEKIDAIDFIDSINNYNKGIFKSINVILNNKTIDNTNGLKIYYHNGKWEIKDFSEKKRFGNRLFLINHVLKINEEKSAKIKKEKLIAYISFLRDVYGIVFNQGTKKININKKIIYDFIKNNIQLNDEIVTKTKNTYGYQNIKYTNRNFITGIIHIYILLEKIKQTEPENYNGINIEYDTLLGLLNLNKTNHNKKRLQFILELGNNIFLYYDKNTEEKTKEKTKKFLYKVKLNKKTFTYHSSIGDNSPEGEQNIKGFVPIQDNILEYNSFFNKEDLRLFLYLILMFKTYKTIKLSCNQIYNILGIDSSKYKDEKYLMKKAKILLEEARSKGIINYYKKNKSTFVLVKK